MCEDEGAKTDAESLGGLRCEDEGVKMDAESFWGLDVQG